MALQRQLETFITLVLEHCDGELAKAHRELYPERISENIPLSLTLLYPWKPPSEVTQDDLDRLTDFFASTPRPEFRLSKVAFFPETVAYAVPEPDEELRSMMRALWAMYPEYPPYRDPAGDPPPHCTLGRLSGNHAITFEHAQRRVEPLLPITCRIDTATLMEEYAPNRCRVATNFPFGD